LLTAIPERQAGASPCEWLSPSSMQILSDRSMLEVCCSHRPVDVRRTSGVSQGPSAPPKPPESNSSPFEAVRLTEWGQINEYTTPTGPDTGPLTGKRGRAPTNSHHTVFGVSTIAANGSSPGYPPAVSSNRLPAVCRIPIRGHRRSSISGLASPPATRQRLSDGP